MEDTNCCPEKHRDAGATREGLLYSFEPITRCKSKLLAYAANLFKASGEPCNEPAGISLVVTARSNPEFSSHAEPLLLNFLAATEKRESAVCDAESSLPVIEILDKIYLFSRQYPAKLGNV